MEGILNAFGKTIERIKPHTKLVKKEKNEAEEIIAQIKEVRFQIMAAHLAFEFETDFDLIESCVLQINSLEKRYNYLIKKAKSSKIIAF